MLRPVIFLSMLVPFLFLGCGQDAGPPADPEVPGAGDAAMPVELGDPGPAPAGQSEEEMDETPKADAVPVTLDIKSWDETQALIAAEKGKIVVVDIWATYCGPCLVEFPHLVKLHNEHGDKVTCISVSLDYQGFEDEPVESYTESVLAVLKSKSATFQNVLCSTESDVVYGEKIKRPGIPIVYVYDQKGQLVGEFPDLQEPSESIYQENVLPLVTKLLNQ